MDEPLIRVLMENSVVDERFIVELGLSLYIEANGRKILFDAGQTDAFAENAAKMGVDLSQADLCVLSHGHYDHSGGLMRFWEINDHAPVYMHRRAIDPPLQRNGQIHRHGRKPDRRVSLCEA